MLSSYSRKVLWLLPWVHLSTEYSSANGGQELSMAKATNSTTLTHETLFALMQAYNLAIFPRNGGTIRDITVSIQDPKGNRFFVDRKLDGKTWKWCLGKKMESRKVETQTVQVAPIAV